MSPPDDDRPTVLLVDDHPLWRDTMRKVLERRDAATVVGEAGDGEEAIEMVAELDPAVVVMDVDMPGVDGLEATRQITAGPNPPFVVVMSSSDEHDQVIAAIHAGANGYLLKTAGAGEVCDAVARTAGGEIVFPPALTSVVLEEFRRRGDTSAPGSTEVEPAAGVADDTGPSWIREGDVWAITWEGTTARIKDLKGLRDIATLLERPGAPVHALDVISARDGRGPATASAADAASSGLHVDTGSGVGPSLDPRARREYKERVEELRAELDEADRFNDPARSERIQDELDFIARELASAVGLGGRDRPARSGAERARVNVTRGVSRAMDRISAAHPSLGAHLTRSLSTGTFCSYDPERDPGWTVSVT